MQGLKPSMRGTKDGYQAEGTVPTGGHASNRTGIDESYLKADSSTAPRSTEESCGTGWVHIASPGSWNVLRLDAC
jgi:hypothetical protein